MPSLCRVFDDDPIGQNNHPSGCITNVGIVGREDKGHALFCVERTHHTEQFLSRLRVEICRWLVSEHDRRARDDGARDCDPLLLPSAEL